MSAREDSKAVAISENIFRRLLAAYPAAHREEYGEPMAQIFRDQSRDAWRCSGGWGLACLWLRVLPDVVGTSFLEHLETIKQRRIMFSGNTPGASRFIAVFAIVFVLITGAATVTTFLLPEGFVGTARVNVQRRGADVKSSSSQVQSLSVDPYLMQSEVEIMQSAIVLDRVIDSAQLADRWGKKFGTAPLKPAEARSLLNRSLEIRPVRNTSLIEIRAYSDKPDEAAEIANGLASAFRDYHLRAGQERVSDLQKQRDDLYHRTALLADEVDALRSKLNVFDPDPRSTAPSSALSLAVVQQLQTDAAHVETEIAKLRAQLDALRLLPRQQVRTAIGSVVEPDTRLNSLFVDLTAAEQNLLNIKKRATEDHPDYVTARQQVELLNQKIDDRVDAIFLGMETRLQSVSAWRDTLNQKIEEANRADAESVKLTRPYWEAKQKLAALIQTRNELDQRLASDSADSQLGQGVKVEVIDRAVPNLRPVRPNKPLNLILGFIAGTVFGLVAASGTAGISFFLRRRVPPKTA